MANIYVFFETEHQRREFTASLLNINIDGTGSKSKSCRSEQEKILELILYTMEKGKTKSPYYRLCEMFYGRRVLELKRKVSPYYFHKVFERGFRRLYYQNIYLSKPGYWVVIQLRGTEQAGKVYKWIVKNMPTDRLYCSLIKGEHEWRG